ncbi:hypothetical protein DUNSADRAFT_8650 [Dunaliella salina]|nr:hypothetical protein DUNSADRAFT_8650 [Dunaliella salina]|eukprot:KAF5834643.1 hypothetical protein DUNSADRAFT_8650 [Dunaliella salina]
MANNFGRLIYHCCHGQDELLEQDMKHVFSIQASNSRYPIQALQSMVVAGGVSRLYIFSLENDGFMASTCQAAADHSMELEQLHSGFTLVRHRRYTSEEAANRPSLYKDIVNEAISEGADAVLGCDFKEPSMNVTQQFRAKQHYLKALWLATAPTQSDFAAAADRLLMHAAENVLSAAQWHPGAHFADAYFGTAAQYSEDFEAAFKKPPSEMAVGASAASYSLAVALKQALELCRFPDLAGLDSNHTVPALDMDRVLFNQSAVECVVEPGMPVTTTGYEWVRYMLAKQRLVTIFGKVEFDESRRNIAKEVVTTQVQSGATEAVLPLELAARDLVMPAPGSSQDSPSSDSQFGGLSQGAFIAIIIVCGSGCILTLMGIQGCLYRIRRVKSLDSQLVIEPKELQIISAPECQWDDSWESGKAMYKGTLVSLDPLPEIWNAGVVDPARSSILKQMREGEKTSKLASTKESGWSSSTFEIQGSSDMGGSITDSQTDIEMGGSPKASHVGFSYKASADLEGCSASQFECDSPGPCSANGPCSHGPSSAYKRTKYSGSGSCPVFTMILTRYEVLKLFWRSRCLQHPSVVPVIGIVWSLAPHLPPSMPVLVRECQELGALASVMENETMTIDAVSQFAIAKDLSDALAYLHTQENPAMKPILQPRLEGVLLDKHCRARVCVPLAALSEALSGKATVWVERTRENARELAHAEEIEDVQTFGVGIANLFTAGKCCSNQNSNAFLQVNREELVHGTVLPCNQYQSILSSHGTEMAELISRCCSKHPSDRPCFVEVKEQLEAKHSKMIHDAARTRRNSSASKSSRRPADAASSSPSADELLYELFPVHVAETLKSGRLPDPEPFPMVSLFFSDVCGYTTICSSLQTHEVMDMLHRLYSCFDELAKDKSLFKELGHIHCRCGIHCGPVMGAVVGTLNRRYGLFGDSVNVASRMESTSIKDHVQCSSPYMQLLREQWPEAAALAVAQVWYALLPPCSA